MTENIYHLLLIIYTESPQSNISENVSKNQSKTKQKPKPGNKQVANKILLFLFNLSFLKMKNMIVYNLLEANTKWLCEWVSCYLFCILIFYNI